MNLSQLNYFKKLAEVLHYTRAAQELFITQPTLSGAISSLEKELGAPLFERNGRSVLLTPYGEVFYEHVCLALRAIDDGVAGVKLETLGIAIDTLTEEQIAYMSSWNFETLSRVFRRARRRGRAKRSARPLFSTCLHGSG